MYSFARLVSCVLALLVACCSLPPLEGRSQSHALPAAEARNTALGQAVAAAAQLHPGLTGVHTLLDAHEAFAARVQLAQHAERTLDVQYYIWRNDTTGHLLLEALRAAAERGVRVRLLLDDNGIAGLDEELAALDAHPNIEVRLFNPFVFRPFKPLGFVTDFSRANRRMHNKSFTADNAITILGGRNVGDEYFGATDGVLFADLDVLATGPVVEQISNSFDAYWASASAYPIASMVKAPSAQAVAAIAAREALIDRSELAATYKKAVRELPSYGALIRGDLLLVWAPAHLLVDDPAKGLALAEPEQLLLHHMNEAVGTPKLALDLVSPYFVPTDPGTDYFVDLARHGVRVRILTNSLAATDVLPVHSGYARHRQRLLEAGVVLYELKPELVEPAGKAERRDEGFRMPGGSGSAGSSGSSLHAKTFGVDKERIFVGSFNFDPRSARLNTELGIIIDSPRLAAAMAEIFEKRVPLRSWEVKLNPDSGALQWFGAAGTPPSTLSVEPATTWWQRAAVWLLEPLPIDWLL
ncbi:Phosphatidylserine/phosphatidylglycerophosphate/cardiolipin synthase [Variovorax sp. HW608]|uniref:phospholipase D family protein n=1 Tax=Variovorax sp. HW608 TaxID=1034889 RepID=UPI00081FAA8C|nr:phospholipase D family protein [Variovorax sp. HW608]SCK26342.1 Phosphatidylserine/phosphatidylglycerophosphate/cardiolipin synthase [Variovorax sp. HW608]